jgi:hypothetical protein
MKSIRRHKTSINVLVFSRGELSYLESLGSEKISAPKPLKMDLTEGSETSDNINQTPGNHPTVDILN